MSWLALSILSAIFLGLYDVAKKASLDENAVLPVLFACSLTAAMLVIPVGALSWLAPALVEPLGLRIEPLPAAGHGLVAAKAGIVTLSWVLTFFAVKHLPISLASPIRASAPLFVLLGAVALFHEAPSAQQWLGIGIILAAYWAFSVIGRSEGIRFERSRWVWMLFAGTLVGAASGLYDKHLLATAHLQPMAVQFWFALYSAALQGLIVAIAWWPRRGAGARFEWRWSIAAVAVLLLISDNAYFRALALPGALVSVVSVVRRTNVVVSFGLGGLAFHEKNRLRKAGALAAVMAGIVLLVR